VSIGPGAMQFTRMPCGAHSIASVRVRFCTPPSRRRSAPCRARRRCRPRTTC
jgi:hypothetical protein